MREVATAVVEGRDLRKIYRVAHSRGSGPGKGVVDGISLRIGAAETVGLVGESGCGKTTTAKMLLRLEAPSTGTVLYRGKELGRLSRRELRAYRASVQAVFQDPWSSLSPRMRVGSIIAEPMVVAGALPRAEIRERVSALLAQVGLRPDQAELYPHEFSGGQRQRIAVARALGLQPELIVLDEPVSALDVSIRAQIMNLLRDIQDRQRLSYFLIAHDLATVRYLCDRIMVMHQGRIVEEAEAEELFEHPSHPYLKALISAALPARPTRRLSRAEPAADTASAPAAFGGCRYRTRCPYAMERCAVEDPAPREIAPRHHVACHLF